MSTPKQPQDHKPKKGPRTVTVQDVTVTVDPDVFDDLDVLEMLYRIQSADEDGGDDSDALAIVPFLMRILGPSYKPAKDALRDPDTGRIPLEKVGAFLGDLMGKLAPNS
ncbi:hypothetical protein [Bifidobacterium stellenboschense]|uniref:Uncharacterized protein n=1 Tax=Bifidobacterium stellenboschense TaxID=762211 RepID=A0A087DQL2_9BIFI|nr:hypothetical protein [Bifidobacterium stellenboschense]KFI97812.1 hypothetical protein BSTEL_0623 [Bifidobacterium stellenboschense]